MANNKSVGGNLIMLGVIFIILGWYNGYFFLRKLIPSIFDYSKTKDLFGRPVKLSGWMVVIPASFLTGTLLITWLTYICAYIFRNTNPMLYANIFSISIFLIIAVVITIRNRKKYSESLKSINVITSSKKLFRQKLKNFAISNSIELFYIAVFFLVWTYLMFRSFFIKDGTIYIGHSVFSDFGPHLAVIRSFSYGSNFPTQYPHFVAGDIRYHFLFQFLVGNLEFLGLRLDWAFNIPSILSIMAFLVLLYSFTVLVLGEKKIAALTGILFFFRSSFAFFTHISGMNSFKEFFDNLKTITSHIGKTQNENWGLWSQKVYVNQRHLPFGMGIMMLMLIITLPLFKKMVRRLHKIKRNNEESGNSSYVRLWFKEFFLSADAWRPKHPIHALVAGILLGLVGFWNGSVIIAILPVLCIMAIMSKHRLEYLFIATLSLLLVFVQTSFFIKGSSIVSPKLFFGFLANTGGLPQDLSMYYKVHGLWSTLQLFIKLLPYTFNFYIELLGLLPFIILAIFMPYYKKLCISINIIFVSAVALVAFLFTRYQLKDSLFVTKKTFSISMLIAFGIFIIAVLL